MIFKKILIILAIILLISCSEKKSDSPVEPGENSSGTLSARIGSFTWNADEVRAYKQDIYTRINGTQEIQDTSNKYSFIKLFIDVLHLKEPKLFGIGQDGNGFNYSAHARIEATLRKDNSVETFWGQYIENFSLLNIITIDERQVRGSFEFRGFTDTIPPDSMNVTNGSISIEF